MNQYLFLLTISPVQSFIAQARKTQDLHAGSRILSELVTKAMKSLQVQVGQDNIDFVFPRKIESESKPNRFTAIIDTDDDIQNIGNKVKEKVEDYFIDTLGKKVLELQPDSIKQLQDYLKIYWIATPYYPQKDYPSQIRQAEKQLGATKNIRYFSQLAETGRKCALNGEYNVKFYRLGDKEAEDDRLFDKKLFQPSSDVFVINDEDDEVIRQVELQEGEGLCAASMLKRFYATNLDKEGTFPSVAKIALLDTLNKNSLAEQYINTVKCINGGYADEQIYYEENLTEKYFKKQGYKQVIEKANYETLRKGFGKMKDSIKKQKLVLSKYYAILVFDADGMGSKLEECKTREQHQTLSRLLGEYGTEAKKYINEKDGIGKTIYAGGDDFLGFLNLNYLFTAMQDLREMFDTEVNNELAKKGYLHLQLSFSAGIAIAHYKTPLSEVLNYARTMEKKAKKIENKKDGTIKKDAFSIAVLKHSGEIHDTTFRWKHSLNGSSDNWSTETLQLLTNHLKNKEISDTFITNLSKEFRSLLDKNGDWGKIQPAQRISLDKILQKELFRFAKRAKSNDSNIDVKALCEKLFALYSNHTDFNLSVQNFLNALHICEFISRHLNKDEKQENKNNPQLQTQTA